MFLSTHQLRQMIVEVLNEISDYKTPDEIKTILKQNLRTITNHMAGTFIWNSVISPALNKSTAKLSIDAIDFWKDGWEETLTDRIFFHTWSTNILTIPDVPHHHERYYTTYIKTLPEWNSFVEESVRMLDFVVQIANGNVDPKIIDYAKNSLEDFRSVYEVYGSL